MFAFLRSDLANLKAYTSHPGGKTTGEIDRLDTNESPYDLPVELKEKLAWLYQNQLETNRYPDGSHFELKGAIAEYVRESANLLPTSSIKAENISVGNGSDELIRSLLIATCVPGQGAILTANPTFSMYGILAKTLGIPVISLPRSPENFAIDLNIAKSAIATDLNSAIRVIFVVHPNSPTANALTSEEIEWLRNLPETSLVVIDEAYFEFSQTSLIGELLQHPNWVILRTFSKAFRLASLRVGYAIAHPEIITALEKVRLPYNLPSFSQIAAKLVLEQRELLLKTIPETLRERNKLYTELSQIAAIKVWPSNANFLYVRLTNARFDDIEEKLAAIAQQLKERGTLVRHTGGGLRITVGTPEENQRTLQRIQEVVMGNG